MTKEEAIKQLREAIESLLDYIESPYTISRNHSSVILARELVMKIGDLINSGSLK
jgi:hypothetical protein